MLDDVEAHLRALGCDPVSLSGSGSTVFGVLPRGRRADAGALARDAAMGGSRVLLTRTASAVAPVIGAD
jgi:4-diphosphocytidyl-2C-methyl-D-erythritol kinase